MACEENDMTLTGSVLYGVASRKSIVSLHLPGEEPPVYRIRQSRVTVLTAILSMLVVGCTFQAPYMRGWNLSETISNRWTGGTFDEKKLSSDEAVVYKELGRPEAVRFFRTLETRQRVYEWVYLERDQVVWFVEGKRVDYVTVDAESSGWTKETRETLRDKLTVGGVVGAAIGVVTAGLLTLGDKLGLRN
jgi:hypothetical protein